MTLAEKTFIHQAQRRNEKSMEILIDQYLGLIKNTAYNTFNMKRIDPAYNQEDLDQLATRGFIEAVKRFDFSRGTELSTYAIPWIKKFLREAFREEKSVFEIDENRQNYKDEIGNILEIHTHTNLLPHDRDMFLNALELLEKLPELDKEIVKDYYGISCDQPLSLEEIGKDHDLDADIIKDIIEDSIKFLRN
ncbi:sigma-70 family RNA polymerase sigma factor [Candidatus Marinimicrobia bacterium MT.SAG.2]|nr:sigma-70 family RNA polymerase sigma factor [Candidatus Marinimicrobia bacterium MT.SAG.2]